MIRSGLPRWGLASAVLFACASGTSAASASPLFELSGGSTGGGGFNARVTGASSASTYFNPALLPYAEQAFETGVLVLTDQISLTLDEATLAAVRSLVGPRGVSAFVDEAVRAKLEDARRQAAIVGLLTELSEMDPATARERAAAERWADELTRRHPA